MLRAMAWFYLLLAGILEIGWPLGLKLSQTTPHRLAGILAAAACIAASGLLLWLAQREIPIGTAYAIWTGIGATGTFIVGVALFGDSLGALRILSVALIIAGIVGLKLAHG